MTEIHVHIHNDVVKEGKKPRRSQRSSPTKATKSKRRGGGGGGLPAKYAKMGFKKGWKEYKKTRAYKAKQKKKGKK